MSRSRSKTCSTEREKLKRATESLLREYIPLPAAVKRFYRKRVITSLGSGKVYADYICMHKGRLLQRVFAFYLNGRYTRMCEFARRYEGGKAVMSNVLWINMFGYDLQALWVDLDKSDNFWSAEDAFVQNNVSAGDPFCYHINEKDVINRYGKYSAWDKYIEQAQYPVSLFKYITLYRKYPKIELLVKGGYPDLVSSARMLNMGGKSFEEIFGCSRKWSSYLKRKTYSALALCRYADKVPWLNAENLESFETRRTEYAYHHININDVDMDELKYLVCNHYSLMLYRDYLSMAEKMGVPLNQKQKHFPKNLNEAHDELQREYTLLQNRETDQQIAEFAVKLADLQMTSRKYGLMIRPALSAEELIDESKALDHCVKSYADRMAQQKYAVFFIRKTSDLNTPYVTLSIENKGNNRYKLQQYHGYRNDRETPLPDEVNQFVHLWCTKKHITEQKNGVY